MGYFLLFALKGFRYGSHLLGCFKICCLLR